MSKRTRPLIVVWFVLVGFCALVLVPVGHAQTGRVSQLISKLKDPDADVRMSAAIQSGDIKDSHAVYPLIDALTKDPSPIVLQFAAPALAVLKDPPGRRSLERRSQGPHS